MVIKMKVNCFECGAKVDVPMECGSYLFGVKIICDDCKAKYGEPTEEDGYGMVINPIGYQYRSQAVVDGFEKLAEALGSWEDEE